ncbi:hypothetical protein Rsub_11683 [Raphidocelis subcapitata]|uniref:Uncharacterized protein n=1 Tax=Raphidocelis subcapitata TaxID=307507 RepID=A0A2V0PKE9_9CHLO|nr:hypothetical protein Rsub_11683 [Raphidocelis subcapitata]|eukprot:GBF98473.1 hypothetical protein Rsub_11683 [Raphidocelis subcapitata]
MSGGSPAPAAAPSPPPPPLLGVDQGEGMQLPAWPAPTAADPRPSWALCQSPLQAVIEYGFVDLSAGCELLDAMAPKRAAQLLPGIRLEEPGCYPGKKWVVALQRIGGELVLRRNAARVPREFHSIFRAEATLCKVDGGAPVTGSAFATSDKNALDRACYRALLLADPLRARHSAMAVRGRELDAGLQPCTADTSAVEAMFGAARRRRHGAGSWTSS